MSLAPACRTGIAGLVDAADEVFMDLADSFVRLQLVCAVVAVQLGDDVGRRLAPLVVRVVAPAEVELAPPAAAWLPTRQHPGWWQLYFLTIW
jgi:hypothetical protein